MWQLPSKGKDSLFTRTCYRTLQIDWNAHQSVRDVVFDPLLWAQPGHLLHLHTLVKCAKVSLPSQLKLKETDWWIPADKKTSNHFLSTVSH